VERIFFWGGGGEHKHGLESGQIFKQKVTGLMFFMLK